jgi:NAD(P)-dependent dehydrogenase (short-subunit alcohol dehydrogenase family)
MPSVLIVGAGPLLGRTLADAYHRNGYKVAVASRTQKLESRFHFFRFDARNPESVPELFEQVREKIGAPDVVISNCRLANVRLVPP